MKVRTDHSELSTADCPGSANGERPVVFLMTNTLETGGSERQFAALAKVLRSHLFQLRLGCVSRRGTFSKELDGLAEFGLGGSFLTLQAQRSRLTLARYLRRQGAAVAHSFDFYSNLLMIPSARLAGVPVVLGSHRQIGDVLTPLQFGIQEAVFRWCDRVVCNSRAAAQSLVDQGLPASKVAIIPNGLPREAFAEATPALPCSPSTLRIGMVARMSDPVKNHPLFLRAAARLAPKHPGLEFVLVGDGPLRPGLEQTARRLGLGDRARFLGERHDIVAILAALDITVLPSRSESSSNAILESMAAGKPVVATRVGGTSELVADGETGLLVPSDDEDRLVEALELLLSRPALRVELGERARRRALDHFTLDQARRRYEQLYTNLLADKQRRPRERFARPSRDAISANRIRVAVVAPSSRRIGGQSVQAGLLIRHWQGDSDVEARFVPVDPELPRAIAWVERVPFLRTIVREPFYLATLWNRIKDVEVVHIFSASYWSFLLGPAAAWLVARLRGKKTLINYRSGEARDHLRRSHIALPLLRRTSRLVVPSGYLVDVFREFGLRAMAVPNVVDLSQFSYRCRRPLRPLLVCTRGFEAYYSVDDVVRAFALVKKEFPSGRLYLVGKGSKEETIRAMVSDLKLSDIEFTGPVSRQNIGRVYDQADIFINASWLDNMPVSILEAFASGTPVVSTAPEGIRYLVEHERTGLLCAPGDWQALGQNVTRLLHEPDLAQRLARNAYEESSRYCWTEVRGQWLEVYQSLRKCEPEGGRRALRDAIPRALPAEPKSLLETEAGEPRLVDAGKGRASN